MARHLLHVALDHHRFERLEVLNRQQLLHEEVVQLRGRVFHELLELLHRDADLQQPLLYLGESKAKGQRKFLKTFQACHILCCFLMW